MNRYTEYEVERRSKKQYGVAALFYRPLWRFFKSYVLERNFLNGLPGLIESVLIGFYHFVVVSKIIEKRIKERQTNKYE